MSTQDGCPLCGSTRFTVEPIDVSSGGRIRHVPGLRSCLDCHDGGAPVLRVEVERLRGLLTRLEWAGNYWRDDSEPETCPVCGSVRGDEHRPDCWLAVELHP